MREEEEKCEYWGLSLSLKPPISHVGHHSKPVCKRNYELLGSYEKQSPKMQKPNMLIPRATMEVDLDVKPTATDLPLVIDLEEVEIPKLYSSSPDSTLTSVGIGKRLSGNFNGERDFANDEEEAAATCSGSVVGGEERKKLRLTNEQIMVLEQAFREHSTVNTKQKLALSRQVNLKPRQVEVWFQNRRARIKLKQTEAECEQLRKLCESLKEENRKLQKELRTLQLSSDHDYSIIHANSHQLPSTLTMCSSCNSVFISSKTTRASKVMGPYPVDVFPRGPLNMKRLSRSTLTPGKSR